MIITPFTAFASTSNMDITTSSVRDDLESMEMDKLSYLSNDYYIFITMAQYYKDDILHSYLYVNLPSGYKEGMKINISTSTMDENYNINEIYNYYELSYVNNDSTWYKLEILNLPNLEETTRRYNLKEFSINENVIFTVDETFIYNGITNDTIKVFNQEVETITITEKDVYFFCYGEESKMYDFWGIDEILGHNKMYTDAWYIFFNTDKEIDTLKEIEITYQPYYYQVETIGVPSMRTEFTEEFLNNSTSVLDKNIAYGEQTIVTITPGTTKISSTDNFWGGYETKYEEIDNILDLRKNDHTGENGNEFVFTEQAKKYTWGVNFLNTEKKCTHGGTSLMGNTVTTGIVDGTGVCNTAIIRLKYEINGIVKNAYAIDIPTDDFTGSAVNTDIEGEAWWQKLVSLLLLVLLVSFISPVLSIALPIIKIIIKGIGALISVVLNILTFPLRLIFKSKRK